MDFIITLTNIFDVLLEFIYKDSFFELLIRFCVNLFVTSFIVAYVYFNASGRKSYVFTYILISTTVFFLCYLLGSIDLQLGFALGLFAIFGIIRYRTDTIPIREMTYLFLVITISVINALTRRETNYTEIIFTNSILMLITWVMEKIWMPKHLIQRTIIYDRLDLIHPQKHTELKEDIKSRTGIAVDSFKLGQIDLSKSNVRITIFYKEDASDTLLPNTELNDITEE